MNAHQAGLPQAERQPFSGENEGLALLARFQDQIESQLCCFDRMILQGTLVDVCHPGALIQELRAAGLSAAELTMFSKPLAEEIRANAQALAQAHGVKLEPAHVHQFRKEDRVAEILAARGRHPGLVCIFWAKERATVYDTKTNPETGHIFVYKRSGCCVHYYFYFLHERLGLIYVRVPTWLPLRLQVYLNGHSLLAQQLAAAGSGCELIDNAFVSFAEPERAQALSDGLEAQALRTELDALARLCCPASTRFRNGYHWSFMQVEYAWDIVFKDPAILEALFEEIAREAVRTLQAEDFGRFLSKRLPPNADTAISSHLGRRVRGLRLRHQWGPAALKLYTKHHRVLRLECTTNDVTFFHHHREVVHRDGSKEYKVAAMKKGLFSLRVLRQAMRAALRRYLTWLGTLTERTVGRVRVDQLGQAARDPAQRSHRGWNLFQPKDRQLLCAVARGEFAAAGVSHRRLRAILSEWRPSQISRALKRLRVHGLLRKIGRTYRYYLTKLGRALILTALQLQEQIVVTTLAAHA